MNVLRIAALVAAVATVPVLAFAGAGGDTKTGNSGQRIGLIFIANCQTHRLPGSAYGAAQHGKVIVTKPTRDICFGKDEPVLVFDYMSDPGFKGNDLATLYIDNQIQTFHVVVQ